MSSSQLIISVNGIIGIDYNAIVKVAKIMSIDLDEMDLQKIKAIENTMITEIRKDGT